MEAPNTYDLEYTKRRTDTNTMFGYGLMRRTQKLIDVVADLGFLNRHGLCSYEPIHSTRTLKVCDMGCSDGAMLKALTDEFHTTFATGIDIFPHGLPGVDIKAGMNSWVHHDLHRDFPYPYGDGRFNLIIASAFYKQLPDQERFLDECERMLEKGGHLVMLDPCMWAVKLFGALGYFDRRYCQHPWSRTTLVEQLPWHLKLTRHETYWTAPTNTLYHLGAEYVIPKFLSMHQAVVLTRV